jgi:hypothetical protein
MISGTTRTVTWLSPANIRPQAGGHDDPAYGRIIETCRENADIQPAVTWPLHCVGFSIAFGTGADRRHRPRAFVSLAARSPASRQPRSR